MKKISIISPCLNEKENLIELTDMVRQIFKKLNIYDYEHIIADNNSEQDTKQLLRHIASLDKKVKILFNAKNFGSQMSTFNAIKYATGDAVFLFLPSDMQDPPELIPKFLQKWEDGFDVVYGTRDTRDENFLMKNIRFLYYRLINKISLNSIPLNISDYQLVDKKILDEIIKIHDNSPFIRSLPIFYTDNSTSISYEFKKRKSGKSKEFFRSLIDTGVKGLIFASNAPFRLLILFGFITSAISIMYGIYSLINHIFFIQNIEKGIPLLLVSFFIFFGLNLFFLGFIGEYISNIYNIVLNKNRVLINEKINFD
jgi:glycosyltransferase involved in cell wall biosynthesis|tara:strand:- start:385 stop:1320 length:936 start_codon:yes stop_codon:yes gene_type:complete